MLAERNELLRQSVSTEVPVPVFVVAAGMESPEHPTVMTVAEAEARLRVAVSKAGTSEVIADHLETLRPSDDDSWVVGQPEFTYEDVVAAEKVVKKREARKLIWIALGGLAFRLSNIFFPGWMGQYLGWLWPF